MSNQPICQACNTYMIRTGMLCRACTEEGSGGFAAIGTDGLQDVIWGVGDTPGEAMADAEGSDDVPADLTVYPITLATRRGALEGDVAWPYDPNLAPVAIG